MNADDFWIWEFCKKSAIVYRYGLMSIRSLLVTGVLGCVTIAVTLAIININNIRAIGIFGFSAGLSSGGVLVFWHTQQKKLPDFLGCGSKWQGAGRSLSA